MDDERDEQTEKAQRVQTVVVPQDTHILHVHPREKQAAADDKNGNGPESQDENLRHHIILELKDYRHREESDGDRDDARPENQIP